MCLEGDNVFFTDVSWSGSDSKYLWWNFNRELQANVSQCVCPLLRDATCLALTYTDVGVFNSICTVLGMLFLTSSQVYVGNHQRLRVTWFQLESWKKNKTWLAPQLWLEIQTSDLDFGFINLKRLKNPWVGTLQTCIQGYPEDIGFNYKRSMQKKKTSLAVKIFSHLKS